MLGAGLAVGTALGKGVVFGFPVGPGVGSSGFGASVCGGSGDSDGSGVGTVGQVLEGHAVGTGVAGLAVGPVVGAGAGRGVARVVEVVGSGRG
jgi:hypothetical protein